MTSTADAAASDVIRRLEARSRATIKAKFINALMPDIWELPGNPNPTIAANARGRRAGARRPAHVSVSSAAGLVRGQRRRAGLGMDLGRHHALGPGPEAHQHVLAGTQLGHAESAQRF